MPTKELRNLFLHVAGSLAPLGVRIAAYRHHSYQEVYRLEEDAGAGCTLRLYYDCDFAVTRLDLAHEGSPDLAQKVQATLTRGASALSPVQQAIFEELSRRFSEAGIRVLTVKHRPFQEVYFLDTQSGAVELMVYYDKAGLVTRITPSRAEYPGAAQAVALALGVQT